MNERVGRDETYRLIRREVCALTGARDVVIVSGPDARGWLQGQLSQDISGLAAGGSAESLVLSPQGKIEAYCRASVLAEDLFVLDTAAGHGDALAARLARFRLRVKVEMSRAAASCVRLRGPLAAGVLSRAGLEPGAAMAGGADSPYLVVAEVSWPGYSGYDVISSTGEPAGLLDAVVLGDAAGFEAARIEAGVPEMGSELTERTIPQEAGDLVSHAVSFTKGCYTGQELVARLDARGGNVARRLRGVVSTDGSEAGVGDVLMADDGREVGRLTSVAFSPGLRAGVALAYVARQVVPPARVVIGERLGQGEIRELPLEIG